MQKSVLEYEGGGKNHAHTLGGGAPCVLLGVGKRSNDTLPPVGGAQQSQVAVGGTEALLRRRRRPLGSSQHLRVLKQVGKTAGSGQVEVFSTVTAARVKVSRGDQLLPELFWCPRAEHSACHHTFRAFKDGLTLLQVCLQAAYVF